MRFVTAMLIFASHRLRNRIITIPVAATAITVMALALTAQRFSTVLLREKSPNLHPVFLRHRWDDAIQAQILDKLSVVVGDVPDSNDRDAEFGVRPGVTTFDTVKRIVRRERGEDAVRVVEGVLEIPNQLSFGFRRIVATLFAVLRGFLALKFVKEGELGAGDVLHLFPEAADAVELANCGDVGILVFRHGFGESDKIPFRKLERAADAFSDRLGNVIRLGGF